MNVLNIDSYEEHESSHIVMGLDLEWNYLNARGYPISDSKTALIQIAYSTDNNRQNTKVAMYHVRRLKDLPSNLVNLLEHRRTKFVGCQVSGDLSHL